MRRILIGALMCSTALAVSAQEQTDSAYNDSIFRSISLGEVTVKASSHRQKGNATVFVPEQAKVKASTSGSELLGRMNMPGIVYNPMTGNIGASSKKLDIRINGVKASQTELAALAPTEIRRVEYHDAPESRYGDVDMVVDIVTGNSEQGGSLSMRATENIGNDKWATMGNLALSYNRGEHAVSLTGNYFQVHRGQWVRDYSETRNYPDATSVTRQETGYPTKADVNSPSLMLNYNFNRDDKRVFNAKFSLDAMNEPFSERGDRLTTLYVSDSQTAKEIYEHTSSNTLSPSLNLYGMLALPNNARLLLDVTGTYIHSRSSHNYTEDAATILSDVRGDKYSFITEAMYEQRFGRHTLSTGLRHQTAFANNRYQGDANLSTALHQNDASVYAQYQLRLEKFWFMANAAMEYTSWRQSSETFGRLHFKPSAAVSYQPSTSLSLRYRIEVATLTPTLDMLSAVSQHIDPEVVRQGNPALRSYKSLNQQFSLSYSNDWMQVSLTARYELGRNPFVETATYDGQHFILSYTNQRRFDTFSLLPTLSLHPFGEVLELSLTPQFAHYHSQGQDYNLHKNLLLFNWSLTLQRGHWQASYTVTSGADNYMKGTALTHERSMTTLLAGYNADRWSFHLGCFNPFTPNYWMKTENFSPLLPSLSVGRSANDTFATAKLTLRLGFGHQKSAAPKHLNNADTDTGIVRGTR